LELLLPKFRAPVPKHPSYEVLDMAFGVGAGATLSDKSRYRSHGNIIGAVPAVCVHGLGLDFDPTVPSFVMVPGAHAQLDFTAEDFSMVVRLNADSLVGNRCIIERGQINTSGYIVGITAAGEIYFYTSQAMANQFSNSSVGDIVVGNWYTVGLSRTGVSIRIYVNGVDVTLVAAAHIDPVSTANNAYIGIRQGMLNWPFDGRIEFFRIFRGIALQTSEHLAWHNFLA